MNLSTTSDVTFVLTSCGRLDLLEQTLDSFLEFNDYPIREYLITEDSADPVIFKQCRKLNKDKYNNKLKFIFNKVKLGQSKSIDLAYSKVKTPLVFHCEDDWQFYKSGFIKDSIGILATQPKAIQVWIRAKADGILNTINPQVYTIPGGYNVRVVEPCSFRANADTVVHNYIGFSWNPGIKRVSDWKLLPDGYYGLRNEHSIDAHYRDLGYLTVSLSTNDQEGFVQHIGWERRTPNTIH